MIETTGREYFSQRHVAVSHDCDIWIANVTLIFAEVLHKFSIGFCIAAYMKFVPIQTQNCNKFLFRINSIYIKTERVKFFLSCWRRFQNTTNVQKYILNITIASIHTLFLCIICDIKNKSLKFNDTIFHKNCSLNIYHTLISPIPETSWRGDRIITKVLISKILESKNINNNLSAILWNQYISGWIYDNYNRSVGNKKNLHGIL